MQDQPVVRVTAEWLRHNSFELGFNLVDILARREAGAIADAEHVRVDRERLFAKGGVEHHVGGFSPDAGKGLQFLPSPRNFAAVIADELFGKSDDVLRLGIEQADRLDRLAQGFLPEINHLLGIPDAREERPAGDIDAGVGRLRGQHDRNQQLIGVRGIQLGRRRWIGFGQAPEEFENLLSRHAPMTSRIE
jgi:hypothetical protein